jgi:predicted metalloprotease with PDZ domain
LTDPKKRRLSLDVLPHEIVHAWCGKFRRPAGMVRSNFHEPKQTKLLWVYEGLTQYLGHLLFVRSGCISSGENIDELAVIIAGLDRQRGRAWRSLEDTARDSWHLRGRSRNWSYLRRNQDYYSEGAVIWMEVDAMIRRGTDGAKSLDDFCRTFFRHAEGDGLVKPFDEPEIYGVLNGLLPHDWAAFFEERVKRPLDSLPLSVVEKLGYRLEYDHEIVALEKLLEEQNNYVRAWSSVGMGVRSTGEVMDVVPGSAADLAGLAPGMEIVGVNDRKFSVRRFREAIADSVTNRGIDLLLLNCDRFQTVRLEYADGQRFLKLVRNPSEPDILGGIFAPLD